MLAKSLSSKGRGAAIHIVKLPPCQDMGYPLARGQTRDLLQVVCSFLFPLPPAPETPTGQCSGQAKAKGCFPRFMLSMLYIRDLVRTMVRAYPFCAITTAHYVDSKTRFHRHSFFSPYSYGIFTIRSEEAVNVVEDPEK